MGFNRKTSARFSIAFRKFYKGIRKILLPNWLQSIPRKLTRCVRKAESTVSASKKKVATSGLGKTARNVGRGIAKAETSLFRSTQKASSNVAKSHLVQGIHRFIIGAGRLIRISATRMLNGVGWLLGLVLPASFRRRIGIAFSAAARKFGFPFTFFAFWMRTRKIRRLVYAIPAILLVMPFGYFTIRIPFQTPAKKAGKYQIAASKALEQEDLATAELYFRKLRQLNGINQWTEFQAAFYQYNNDQGDRAVDTMKRLAPTSEIGFTPAHVWLAQYYYRGESELPLEQANRLSKQHIELALTNEPTHATARALRAAHLKREGLTEEAIRELRDVVQKLPAQRLSLAEMYYSTGKKDEAFKQLKETDRHFEQRVEGNVKLKSFDYQLWGAVKTLLGQPEEAHRIFAKGLAEYGDDKMLTHRAVTHFLAMADLAQGNTDESAERHVGYLMQAFEAEPNNKEIIKRLVRSRFATGPLAAAAQKAIEGIEARQDVPASFWSIMGTGYGLRRQYEESWRYLSKAVEAAPEDARVFNNAAWVLLQLNRDKENALTLINQALAIDSENPVFRETRGQVLLRFNNWNEAIEDLEFASNGLNNPSPDLHEGLASAYENLNNTELAKNHRQIAKRLRIRSDDVH